MAENLDTTVVVQPTTDTTNSDGIQVQTSTEPIAQTDEIDVPGIGKVKLDELKEWKQGYMRQADYTKKTQSLASQRKEAADALEIYEYLKSNPITAQQIANGEQVDDAFIAKKLGSTQYNDLADKIAGIELDATINTLKTKYKDFDEVEVLNKASELGIADLEFVYKGLKSEQVNMSDLEKSIRAKISEELKQNGINTQTIITSTDPVANVSNGLTAAQLDIATKMGLTPEEYAKGL